jgi:hypothetical protein
MTSVVITQNAQIETAIAEALGSMDLAPRIGRKRVAVKPNDTWASADDTTGVTQPDTLRAVLRCLKHYGPHELIVTGGAGAAETDAVFRLTGLMDVVAQEGATLLRSQPRPFSPGAPRPMKIRLTRHPCLAVAWVMPTRQSLQCTTGDAATVAGCRLEGEGNGHF